MRRFLAISFCCLATLALAQSPLPSGVNLLEAARHNFESGKFDAAWTLLDQAARRKKESGEAIDLRGLIRMEQGKWRDAEKFFRAAHAADAHLFTPRLHLGDLLLREKKYAAARDVYADLFKEANILISVEKLRYAILLTYLAQHDEEHARQVYDKIVFPTESPAYYYAQAAWEFAHGKERDARKWLNTGNRIFDARETAWFAQPLYDLGWIKKKPQLVAP